MKHFISALFILAISFTSCNREEEDIFVPAPTWGTVSANINGEAWEGQPRLLTHYISDSLYYVDLNKYNQEGFLRNQLSIRHLSLALNKIPLERYPTDKPSATFWTILEHGDVLGGTFELLENDTIEDFIQFTEINEDTKEVKGVFQASFALTDTLYRTFNTLPDTIVFRNGIFHTKLIER